MNLRLFTIAICLIAFFTDFGFADDQRNKTDYTALSNEQLISGLCKINKVGVGFHPTAWASGFIAIDNKADFNGGVLGSEKPVVNPYMRELTRRGIQALNSLIEHISDNRQTNVKVSGMMWQIFSDEYFPKDSKNFPSKIKVNTNKDDLEGITSGEYTIKVGDICYVLIGQIVNRRLNACRYEPTGGLIINSPIKNTNIATAVRYDWKGISEKDHKHSLTKDLESPMELISDGAYKRIKFYYPKYLDKLNKSKLKTKIKIIENRLKQQAEQINPG